MSLSIARIVHKLLVALALLAGVMLIAPEAAFASSERPGISSCKRKKRTKRARRKARRARRARAKRAKAVKAAKVDARRIKQWQRQGLSNEAIVEKAREAGYTVTPREKRRMKKMRVRSTLVTALAAPAPSSTTVVPASREPIDLEKTIDPNEIDFESVPPPKGMPTQYANAAKPAPEADKKPLNTSLRPSAPFVAKPRSDDDGEKKPRRVVISAAD